MADEKFAEVKFHNGTPTFFYRGKPAFYGMMWGGPPEPDRYPLAKCARYYAEAGVHYYAFDVGVGGDYPDWAGPREGFPDEYNFSNLGIKLEKLIEIDPEAKFHLRIHVEMPGWWRQLYPEECEIDSRGVRLNQSFASTVWRSQVKQYLRAMVDYFKTSGYFERVIAYQIGAGHTGEWCKGLTSMREPTGDYSRPMREHFQNWLKQKYNHDVKAFQSAWASPHITFDTAEVPDHQSQVSTTHFSFRDPRKEQPVIDYYRCLAELCGDLVIDYCKTVKEATNDRALAGAFYGYILEMAWNAGFFSEGPDSEYSTLQRSGHLGLWKVLQSPYVDFLVSPLGYGFRGIGGEGPSMLPTESVRLHNKLYVYEEDSRTHLTWHDHPNYGKTNTLNDSIAVLQRNFAYVLTHGHAIWWLAGSPTHPHIELSQQPAFRPLIRQFQKLGEFANLLDRRPGAEIAVLVDDESFFYESIKNDLDIPLIFQQRLWGLPKLGAPVDTYLLQDLVDGNLPDYKLYIFLNPFHLDEDRRELIKKRIRINNHAAVWIYAPGYIKDSPSMENMTDLTAFNFAMCEHPWGPMMHLIRFDHPITQAIPQDFQWGTNARLGPLFHVEDESALVLGNVVFSRGRCVPGFAVKQFTDWTSIYIAAPNLPAPILRGIARYAGVHG